MHIYIPYHIILSNHVYASYRPLQPLGVRTTIYRHTHTHTNTHTSYHIIPHTLVHNSIIL